MATIRKRNAKWQVQVRRNGYAPISRSFSKRSDADEWARLKETQADRSELQPSAKDRARYKISDVLSRYEKEVTPSKKGRVQERRIIQFLLKQKFSDLTFDVINESHIADYRDLRLKTVKPATYVREIAVLQHALDVAGREWNYPLKNNPVSKVKKPRINNARDRRLGEGELAKLLQGTNTCKNPLIKSMILFAIQTGMRQSEIINMQWADIDLETSVLVIPVTKNGHSRTIPLSNQAIETLNILPRSKSTKVYDLTINSFRQSWKRLIKRTDIKNLHFHDLRHEAISRFFEHGLTVPEVAMISGHRDYRMLFRYTHLRPEDISKKLG